MKERFEHIEMQILDGWVEYDIKWVKPNWWSKWEIVMDGTSPMLYKMKHHI